MADISKGPKLRILMFSALLTAGLGQLNNTALAADGNVSQRDMLDQAVVLYEKLNGEEIVIPEELKNISDELFLGKSVMLGFINADEMKSISEAEGIRKQDAMTVLYKTIINFDDSYAISTQEVDEVMNSCNDNALIDEENRVGYAFMIKHGIIQRNVSTEPNKEITWENCSVLIDMLYDIFMQNVSFNVSGNDIKIGSNVSALTETFGEPDRIDNSEYGFKWYVYNNDYNRFMMVGVDEDRICAFYTNARDFGVGDIKSGDDYAVTYKYADDKCYNFYADNDGKIDAVFYNSFVKSEDAMLSSVNERAYQLVDLINSNRVKKGYEPVLISTQLWKTAGETAAQPKYKALAEGSDEYTKADNEILAAGFDVFLLYAELVKNNPSLIEDRKYSLGVGTDITSDDKACAAIVVGDYDKNGLTTSKEDIDKLPIASTHDKESGPDKDGEQSETDDVVDVSVETGNAANDTEPVLATVGENDGVPVIVSPVNEEEIKDGSDLKIKLEKSVADEYYVKIYSFEDDEYIIDSYINTKESELVFESKLFEKGKDYQISVSAVTDNSVKEAESFIVRYGSNPDINILQGQEFVTDNDYIDISWESEVYHDFVIDIYDEEGKLVLSKEVANSNEAKAINVSPGNYFVYVSAIRRGDREVIKAQDSVKVTVNLPEPVITEYILDDGEKFYPVYEDKEMGVVYFYDEEIVDIKNGSSTVKKKKITEKQVKATNYYKQLAATQAKVECFNGSNVPDTPKTVKTFGSVGNFTSGKISLEGDVTAGQAIVEEAKKYLGVPYLWGGTTPKGFDCSGFVQYVCKALDINVSRVSQDQYFDGIAVSREDLQPGDLVFFQNNGDVHHVGIYVGDGMMIHAPYTGEVVKYQSIDTPYYAKEFCGGRRVY